VRGERKCEMNSPADTKAIEEGGGGTSPGTRAQISLQPVEDHDRASIPTAAML